MCQAFAMIHLGVNLWDLRLMGLKVWEANRCAIYSSKTKYTVDMT